VYDDEDDDLRTRGRYRAVAFFMAVLLLAPFVAGAIAIIGRLLGR
jgi:hypothetical protein